MSRHRLIPALCTALLASVLHLNAYAADAVEVKSMAEQEVEVVEKGKKVIKRVPVDKAVPGSEIVYTTTFKNLISKPNTVTVSPGSDSAPLTSWFSFRATIN